YFSGENYQRYHLMLDDATLETEQVLSREYTLTGTEGNDRLYGWSSHDVLIGGAGDDYLAGGNNGSDRYLFEPGHGHDVIEDRALSDDQADTVVFRQAQSGQATFDHVGSDLVIHAYGDDNSVTLKNYFCGDNYQRFDLQFEDMSLNYPAMHNDTGALAVGQGMSLAELAAVDGSVNRLIDAMAAFAPEAAAQSAPFSEPENPFVTPLIAHPGQ
ncbi:hypothetical protein QI600_004890, partial [Salmonella enterica]|nr:hypothetical protein [Salmonella enterica]